MNSQGKFGKILNVCKIFDRELEVERCDMDDDDDAAAPTEIK